MRNSTVELLRFIFIYLIVIIHIFLHGYDLNYDKIFALGRDISTISHFEMIMIGKLGVIGFIFISGYYGIKLSFHKIISYLSVLYFYLIIFQFIFNPSLKGFADTFFHPYDKWWFIRYYFVLMLMSPIINAGWNTLSLKWKKGLVFSLAYVFFVGFFLGKKDSHTMMTFLVIYIMARYISALSRNSKNKIKYISVLATFIYLLVPILLVNSSIPSISKYIVTWFSYNNILLLFISAGLVIWADNHSFYCTNINSFASSIIAIYIITDYYQLRIYNKEILPYMFDGLGYFYCFLICIACVLFDRIRAQIFKAIKINHIFSIQPKL